MRPATKYATQRIPRLLEQFPAVAKLFTPNHPLLSPIVLPDLAETTKHSKPHMQESLKTPTNIPFYERWKAITIAHAGIGPLVEQKEKFG